MVNCNGQEFIIYFLPFFIANLFSSLLIIDHNIVTEKGPNRWTHLYIIRFDLMSINFLFSFSRLCDFVDFKIQNDYQKYIDLFCVQTSEPIYKIVEVSK